MSAKATTAPEPATHMADVYWTPHNSAGPKCELPCRIIDASDTGRLSQIILTEEKDQKQHGYSHWAFTQALQKIDA